MTVPYARIGGIEFNQSEVAAYLANSPANVYGFIECLCPALALDPVSRTPRNFTTPAATPAAWYDPETYGSGDFLGVGIEEVQGLDGQHVTRQMTDRVGGGVGGSTLGPLHLKGRELRFKALLLSTSEAGDAYGQRWVNSVLQGQCTSGDCLPYDVNVREYCPGDVAGGFYNGWWTLRRAGVTTGLTWQPSLVFPYCVLREFTFAVTSEYPYLYSNPNEVVAPTSLFMPGGCVNIQTYLCGGTTVSTGIAAPKFGDLCPIITIAAGSAQTGELWVEQNGDILYYIGNLPANSTFTVDCSTQTFTLTDAAGVSIDGTPYLELALGSVITWPVVNCGSSATISVTGAQCGMNSSSTVSIATVLRQL